MVMKDAKKGGEYKKDWEYFNDVDMHKFVLSLNGKGLTFYMVRKGEHYVDRGELFDNGIRRKVTKENPITREDAIALVAYAKACNRIADFRGYNFKPLSKHDVLDLREIDFGPVDFSGAKLKGALFYDWGYNGTRLKTNLKGANFSNADLTSAVLSNLDLSGANFASATLSYAFLDNCNLANVNFQGAMLNNANLSGSNFTNVKLEEARTFDHADVSKVYGKMSGQTKEFLRQSDAD